MGFAKVNFFRTKLTAQLLAGGTSCTITTGDGTLLSGVSFGTDVVRAILRHQSGQADTYREIVDITARSTDTLTITRARESTSAAQFEVGDYLDYDLTAAQLAGLYFIPNGFVDGATPTGTVNGSNVTFTLANAPSPAASLQVFVNGLLQRLTTDYTLSSTTITFVVAPQTGDNLITFYRY